MQALDAGSAGAAWRRMAAVPPAPSAIVAVSAHWETAVPTLTAAATLSTIHDFGGFPAELYRLQYPATGAPELAARIAHRLREAGFDAALDPQRGLDHGAWVPLREMYPAASIPVLQLSLQPPLGPAHHYRMGRALAALGADNILVIGTGSITHNLRDGMLAMRGDTAALSYVPEFQQWVYDALARGDIDTLLAYRTTSRHGPRAHPTDEHFLPLFVALGAAGAAPRVEREYNSIAEGMLGMDCYRFSSAA